MANSADPDQTAPIGEVCSGSTLFASILNLSVMLGNYLQQTTSADNIFRFILLGALRVNIKYGKYSKSFAENVSSRLVKVFNYYHCVSDAFHPNQHFLAHLSH